MKPEPRLMDVCPAFKASMAEFDRLVGTNDIKGANEAWKRAVAAARAYRRLKLLVRA